MVAPLCRRGYARPAYGDSARCLAYGVLEDFHCELRRWRLDRRAHVRPGRVEPDKRVEVDHAAALVLGDLGVADLHDTRKLRWREPGGTRQGAAEVDGGAAPQRRRERVPHYCGLVVEAVEADRLTEAWIVGLVAAPAASRTAVLASRGWVARMAWPYGAAALAATVDRPERWCGEGDEQARMRGHSCRYALAAAQARGDQVPCVAAVDLAARLAA